MTASPAHVLDLARQRILVTGSAGFIGFSLTLSLLEQGFEVFSFDSINDYYSVELKHRRLKVLGGNKYHHFTQGFLESKADLRACFENAKPDIVVNLAAQAGVRYSISNPQAYIDSNISGFQNILDLCVEYKVKNLVYASSSSVYGMNGSIPFSEQDGVNHPMSMYAATKKANEMVAHSYSNIHSLPTTGLRFFTVYGPWGRPDMAMYLFADAILTGRPIKVFNNGNMRRDFTYVNDIVNGITGAMKRVPQWNENWDSKEADPSQSRAPYRIYNLGNNKPADLLYMIGLIEKELGKEAIKEFMPIQPGDVPESYANIDLAKRDLGFSPATSLEKGVHEFITWFKSYQNA
jgi:UDP-glucuronate 4-epimerase